MKTNEKTQHTPGPWTVTASSNPRNGTGWRDIVSFGEPFTPSYVGEAMEKDARLIAAAPELLEQLRDAAAILSEFKEQGYNVPEPTLCRMRAAIARAKGGDL